MPAHPHTQSEALQHFASLLAQHLSAQLAPHALQAELPAGAEKAPAEEDSLHAVLRFEGALAGECSVRLAVEDAERLASGGTAATRTWLESLLDLLCEPLAETLFNRYGRVRIHRLDENAPVSSANEVVAVLNSEDARGARMFVLADSDFLDSLARVGRAAAAAEASGMTHGNLGLVMDVELEVSLRFGQRQLSLREVLDLGSGSVVELDSQVDEPVELILDGRVVARGEAVIVDGNYGVRITEVLHPVVY